MDSRDNDIQTSTLLIYIRCIVISVALVVTIMTMIILNEIQEKHYTILQT